MKFFLENSSSPQRATLLDKRPLGESTRGGEGRITPLSEVVLTLLIQIKKKKFFKKNTF